MRQQTDAFILKHCPDERLHPVEIDLATRQGLRVDDDECLPDARAIALVPEEGIGFAAERRAGECCADLIHP